MRRRRVTSLAVDTQRANEYADENESTHIKQTEQFRRVERRGSILRPSSRSGRSRAWHDCVTWTKMRNALEIRDNLSLRSEKVRPRRRTVPLKYSGDFRSLIADVISVRRSSPLSATTRRPRGLEDLINACQIVPANPFECCNPNAASAADSRPAAAEHQFVCRGNERKHQSPCALPDVCARLQCILNILPVVQRLSADVALVYLCLANETTPADRAKHAWSPLLFLFGVCPRAIKWAAKPCKNSPRGLFLIESSRPLVTLFISPSLNLGTIM